MYLYFTCTNKRELYITVHFYIMNIPDVWQCWMDVNRYMYIGTFLTDSDHKHTKLSVPKSIFPIKSRKFFFYCRNIRLPSASAQSLVVFVKCTVCPKENVELHTQQHQNCKYNNLHWAVCYQSTTNLTLFYFKNTWFLQKTRTNIVTSHWGNPKKRLNRKCTAITNGCN